MKLEKILLRLNLDKKEWKRKPTSDETRYIMTRLAEAQVAIPFDELAQAIERGQTFTPALKAGTLGSSWQSQEIIAVDIDNKYPPEKELPPEEKGKAGQRIENPLLPVDALEMLLDYGIDPALMYESFSCREDWARYRILIVLDEPLTDKEKAKDYAQRLADLFNSKAKYSADLKVLDAARLLYGGRQDCIIHYGSETTPASALEALPIKKKEQPPEKKEVEYRDYDAPGDDYLLEALGYIDPDVDGVTWVKIGTALKKAGFGVDVWDSWSSSKGSKKYKQGECQKRWNKLDTSKVDIGTLVYIAKEYGFDSMNPSDSVKAAYKEAHRPAATDDFGGAFARDAIDDGEPAAPQQSAQEAPEQPPEQTEGKPLETPPAPQQSAQEGAGAQQGENVESNPLDAFESFMTKIQTEAYRPVKTGMAAFDRMLYGGIPRQSLIMLTAAPGAGKTTFCQQVFESAAAEGTDVAFINLEMSREQLLARSLSRLIHQQGGNINAMEIMRGYKWTDAQREYIERAANYYREKVNPYMHYNPIAGTDIRQIMTGLEKAAARCKKMGRKPPIAVIDYLHLITGKDEKGRDLDAATVIKDAVKRLKDWAIANDSYVFAIGANNRAANSKGTITLESGRDTSAIEYSADIQLSLNYRLLHERRRIEVVKWVEHKDEHGRIQSAGYERVWVQAKADDPDVMEALQRMPERDMIIQVLKSRMIPARGKLYMRFNAASSLFTPIADPMEGYNDFVALDDDPDNPWIDDTNEDEDEYIDE